MVGGGGGKGAQESLTVGFQGLFFLSADSLSTHLFTRLSAHLSASPTYQANLSDILLRGSLTIAIIYGERVGVRKRAEGTKVLD